MGFWDLLSLTGKRLTFDEAVSSFIEHLRSSEVVSPKTVRNYHSDYRQFGRFLSERHSEAELTQIEPVHIEEFMASLSHLHASSRRRKLNALSTLFQRYLELGDLSQNPVDRVRPPRCPKRLPRPLSKEQVARLLGAKMSHMARAVVCCMLYGGMRRGEVLSLTHGDVDWEKESIRIRGKGDKERVVQMHSDLRRALKEHLGEQVGAHDAPLFQNKAGRQIDPSTFQRLFQGIVERAGLAEQSVTSHRLRHTNATMLMEAGHHIREIQDWLGHESISTTALYLGVGSERKRDMATSCQSALKTDPPSASNIDPPEMVFYEALFASRVLILQLWLPVSMMSQ